MRGGYGKVFGSMYTGSMLGAGPVVFAVWSYVIAHVGRDSRLEINPDLLAAMIGCEAEDIEIALEYLTAPDPKSRSKKEDGRRLLYEGGFTYFVVNYEEYRDMVSRADNARRQQEWRARQQEEKEEEPKKAPAKKKPKAKKIEKQMSREYSKGFEEFWFLSWKRGHKAAAADSWAAALEMNPGIEADLRDAVRDWAEAFSRRPADKRPHVSTWLNNRGWDDDLQAELASAKGDQRKVGTHETPTASEQEKKRRLHNLNTAIMDHAMHLTELEMPTRELETVVQQAIVELKELRKQDLSELVKATNFGTIHDEMLSKIWQMTHSPDDAIALEHVASAETESKEAMLRMYAAMARKQARDQFGIADIASYDWEG